MLSTTATSRFGRLGDLAARVGAGLGLLWLLAALPAIQGGAGYGFDFFCYYGAAARLALGQGLYLAQTLAGPFVHGGPGTYVYAPPLAVVLLPLTTLPYASAVLVWYLLRLGLLGLACALLPVSRTLRFAAFSVTAFSGAFLSDQTLGNVNVLILLGLVLAWRWLERPVGAVALALTMSIRPQLAAILAIFALRRRWQPIALVLATLVGLVLVSLPFVGIRGYDEFVRLLENIRFAGSPNNVSLDAVARILGLPDAVGTTAFLAGAGLALGAIWWARRRGPEVGFIVGVSASLLVTPLLWPHYLVLLVIPAVFAAAHGRRWALVLPLLTWLPPVFLPALAIIALLLPFTIPSPAAAAPAPA